MSWKFLITCFILLVLGFSGLQIIDQRIVSVNKQVTGVEKKVYIEHFQVNLLRYVENLKINLSLLKSLDPDQVNNRFLTELATNYSSLYPAFDSLYLMNNSTILFPFSNNYTHMITELSFEQKAKLETYMMDASREDDIVLSKPMDFFSDGKDYILFFVPLKNTGKNETLVVLFNLKKIIDDNISSFIQLEDIALTITTPSNKLIYGNKTTQSEGDRVLIDGFQTPIGVWNFEVVVKNPQQFYYLRQLIWVLGFALMFFLVFYMLIVDRKNRALTKNLMNLKEAEQQLKKQYDREQVLRKIIQNIHSAKDINNLLQLICYELGRFLKTDFAGFIDIGDNAIVKVESLSDNIKTSFLGEEISKKSLLFNHLIDQKQFFISQNLFKDERKIVEEIKNSEFKKVRALMIFPIIHNDEVLGLLTFANIQNKELWHDEDIEFIASTVKQIALAMNQANLISELFSRSKTIFENITQEQCLKNIIRVIRTSVDLNEICYFVNKEITNFLGMDKAYIVELDSEQQGLISIRGEYKVNNEIVTFEENQQFKKQLSELLKIMPFRNKMKQLVYTDCEAFFTDEIKKNIGEVFSKEFFLESFVTTPIIFQNKLFGTILVAKVQECFKFQPSELDFLTKVAEQVAIAMYQVKLYDELKTFTDKQVIINRIFEVIRSSIDIDEILWNAVHEIGMYLEVNRCGIIEYNAALGRTIPFKYEFLSDRFYKSAMGLSVAVNPDNNYVFHCVINEKRPFIYEDCDVLDGSDSSNDFIKYLKRFQIKSCLMLPIIYAENVLAFLVLGQCEKMRRWNESEIYFLKSLSNQIAIALHQARLFNELNQANKKLLESYQKEQSVRRILEVVRSSFNLNSIYKDITEEIGKILDVNRCYFLEYDSENNNFLAPKVEYLSDETIPSVKNYTLLPDELQLGLKLVNKGAIPFIIDDLQSFKLPNFETQVSEKLNTKSLILMPITHQKKPLGILVVSQTDYPRRWKPDELEVLKVIADHLGIAISQVKMYEYVQEMSRLKGEFLASVSHELKTPLNSIIVLSELMQNKDSTKSFEEQVDLLKIIHQSGEDLLKHINNILDMAKIEFTNKEVTYQNFNLHDLIKEVRLLVKPLIDEKELKLIVNIDDNLPTILFSDRKLFKLILNNLMNNAIKFTHQGYIELSFSAVNSDFISQNDLNIPHTQDSRFLFITVKDTGIGIEEKYFSIIFDEFRQIEHSEVRKYSGTGLGLSICKKSVDILCGKIWLESQIGQGTTFKVIIPMMTN